MNLLINLVLSDYQSDMVHPLFSLVQWPARKIAKLRTIIKNYVGWSESNAQFFLHWYCGWDVEISPRYSLKFSLQTQCFFFMCNIMRKAWIMQQIWHTCTVINVWRAVWFLWAKGHNQSEIHRDMWGKYGEDCMDHSNISKMCEFFKELLPLE